ncbi:MAG TPA: hypothetical protein DIS66_06085 [Candidatus Omnitrophica bacterium]|mgnify:CR=1 FL=1|nr:hypothetical protein [Candidatus Omnitrophota bacterium]
MKFNMRKIFTNIFILIFLINSVFPAQAQFVRTEPKAKTFSGVAFQAISVPESLAFKDKSFRGKKREALWILNDAHAVPSAQESISQTLQYLQKEAGLNFVGVEGATGYFETTLLRAFPDSEKLEQSVRELWGKGEISGATLAALTSGKHARYFGVETSGLYEQGLRNYFIAKKTAPAHQEKLNAIQAQIKELKQKLFSKELRRFDDLRLEMKTNSAQSLPLILDLASREIADDISQNFQHLFALAQELKGKHEVSSEALSVWSREIGLKIKSQAEQKKWSEKEQAWQTGNFSDAQFAAFALQFCREQGWAPRIPEELQVLARRGETLARMRSKVFVREWEQLLVRLEVAFAKNQIERDLMVLTHQAELLSDWLRLELSSEGWKRAVKPFSFVSDSKMKLLSADLESLRQQLAASDLARFYENAEAREKDLIENTLKQMRREGQTTGVLIAGGFHTEGLANKLEQRDISYSVLTPAIAELPAESRYDALMHGDVSWKNYLRAENKQIQLYESFARAMTHQLLDLEKQQKDPIRILANYKAWREHLIRGIHAADAKRNLQALALLDEIVLEAIYPDEYAPLKQNWKKTFSKIWPVLTRLKKIGKLSAPSAGPAFSGATAMFALGNPLVPEAPAIAMPGVEAPTTSPAVFPSETTAPTLPRSEMRVMSPLMAHIKEGTTDLFFVHAAVSSLLDKLTERHETEPVSFENIRDHYRWKYSERYKRLTEKGFVPALGLQMELADELLSNALNALSEGEASLFIKNEKGYFPRNPRALAIKGDHAAYIRRDLIRAIEVGGNGFKTVIQDYARNANESEFLNPIEGKWPILKAVLLLEKRQREKLLRLLLEEKTFTNLPLVQSMILMLQADDSLGWLRQQIIESIQKKQGAVSVPTKNKNLKIFAFVSKNSVRFVLIKNASGKIIDTGVENLGMADQGVVLADLFRGGLKLEDVNVLEVRNAVTNAFYSAYAVSGMIRNGLSVFIPAETNEEWQVLDFVHRSETRLRKENGFVNVKDFPFLSNHTVYSRQFEAGLPRHLLEKIESAALTGEDQLVKEFGISKELAAALVAQVNLTGGLGALMPDLFEAWEANAMPVTGIHPLWNWIKNRPEKALGKDGSRLPLGNMVKQYMEDTGIHFEVALPITQRYRSYAQNSRARELLTAAGHKQIFVRIYKTYSHFQNAPQYYLDSYYVENGKEVPVFGEVYDDDNALRDFHMAVFSQASQTLIQKLEGKGDPEDIVLLDHEVFTSIPAARLNSAKLATLNHTVFRPGLYEPSESSYELLGFPEWLRGTIAHDGKISIADYTAEAYDLLTGVGLVEHVPALHTNIFRWGWQKLRGFFDGKRRSTNGVYLPRWQSHPRRKLIEDYKKRLNIPAPKFGLPVEASDHDFFIELDKKKNAALKKDFILKNEAVGASDAAELLIWLYEKHGFEWLRDSLGAFIEKGNVANLIADLNGMRANLNDMIGKEASADKQWEAFFRQRGKLIHALLQDPIGANVRRQVPYKGPDKYVEVLNSFLTLAKAQTGKSFDQGALFQRIKGQVEKGDFGDPEFQDLRAALKNSAISQEIREQMARVIIGGRTFDMGAHERFLYIRFMANLLGLESRFATVENYNYHEARLIFKGAQAGIMLSDEILEASATSMEKAQTNMAEVIGVFGGAVPEIWIIRSTQTGEIKEVLDKDSDPAMTHNELREKLKSGEWEILNGILVEYQDGSRSEQIGGLRRPSAASLVAALKQLRASRGNPETRHQRMYDTLASSWKVDMVTSQAQAHAYLLEGMLKIKADQKALLGKTKAADEDFKHIASAGVFNWNVQRENLHPFYRGGMLGFVSAFRWLKSWQKPHQNSSDGMASRGEDALAAIQFHAANGDVFEYLLKNLAPLSDGVEPLRERIRVLQDQAKKAEKERVRVALNLEALELVDQFFVKTAGEWLEEYVADTTSPERRQALREVLEKSAFVEEHKNKPQQPWAEYIARYLDHHPLATPLETSDTRVRSFVFAKSDQPILINLSVNAASSEEKDAAGKTIRKARATVYLNESAAKILGGESFGKQELYRVTEPAREIDYKLHTAVELQDALGVGIPMPLGVEVLAWRPAQAELAGVFQRAFQAKSFSDAVNTLSQRVQDAASSHTADDFSRFSANGEAKEAFLRELADLASLDPRSAEHLFTQDGRKAVMAFILMTHPELLDSVKQWHRDFYAKLQILRSENPDFFNSRSSVRVINSSRNGTLVLARQDGNGNLLFASLLFYVSQREINFDGKVNTTLSGLEGLLVRSPYKITDGLTRQIYGERSDLLSSWVNRIPFNDRSQFLILEPVKRSEFRGLAESQQRSEVVTEGRMEAKGESFLVAAIRFMGFAFNPGRAAWAEEVLHPVYAAGILARTHPEHFVPALILSSNGEWMTPHQENRSEARLWDQLGAFASKHFEAHPNTPLHLGFTVLYDESLDEMLLAYAEKINMLQKENDRGSLIKNRLTVFLAPNQKMSENFSRQAPKLGIVSKQLSAGKEAAQIVSFLKTESARSVFAYGFEAFNLSDQELGGLRPLIVVSAFSPEATFNPAVMLNLATASEGSITADVIQRVFVGYQQFVRLTNGSLALLENILKDKLLELQVKQLISSMA